MTNSLGLSSEIIETLVKSFSSLTQIEEVKVYGSRAKGNFTERSDVDLAVFGVEIDRFTISTLLLELDDSNIPYQIDAQNYADITNQKLKHHIDRVGISIYQKR